MKNSLNNRMQRNYENPARHLLTRRVPVIVRVDGRAFHTFTRNFRKPFDQRLIDSMIVAATTVVGEMQGFKLGYIQSDEASFVMTDYDNLDTDAWFGYVKSKIESVTASIMTAAFARCMRLANITTLAYFDARAFNIPASDVANYFLGRAKDWHRNSVSMYARSFFSHQDLKNKCIPEIHEMLHNKGRNWSTDLTDEEKNGTFITVNPLLRDHCPRPLADRTADTDSILILSDVEPHYPQIGPLWESVEPCEILTNQTTSRATSSEPVENANDSESNTTPDGSKNGIPGDGT